MRTVDPEALELAEILLRDGCPYSKTAETVGVDHLTLMKYLPGYKNHSEWQSVWAEILNSPRLLALHFEVSSYLAINERRRA